jgi:hypothetical protein
MDVLFVGLSCDEHSCMKHIPTCLALKSFVGFFLGKLQQGRPCCPALLLITKAKQTDKQELYKKKLCLALKSFVVIVIVVEHNRIKKFY